jgi:hypothetical protein
MSGLGLIPMIEICDEEMYAGCTRSEMDRSEAYVNWRGSGRTPPSPIGRHRRLIFGVGRERSDWMDLLLSQFPISGIYRIVAKGKWQVSAGKGSRSVKRIMEGLLRKFKLQLVEDVQSVE